MYYYIYKTCTGDPHISYDDAFAVGHFNRRGIFAVGLGASAEGGIAEVEAALTIQIVNLAIFQPVK